MSDSDRLRIEQALLKSEERFRRVVESAPNAMVMVNAAGTIDMVNAQAERVFGYARAEMLGQPVEMLVPRRFRSHHPGLRQSFFADPKSRPMGAGRDLFGLRRDGSEFPVEIGLNPIETDEGPMVLSAIVDISDRKHREDDTRRALREKDILLGEIHHRVKNNLHIVHSLLDLQLTRIDDVVVQGMLRDSQNRVRSMALIHQTLYQQKDFSGVDFGAFLDTLIPTLISSYGADPSRIALSIEAEDMKLPINVAIPCGLMVNELISNALKHAFPAGRLGRLSVCLELKPDADGDPERAILTVDDDGIGIPEALDLLQSETLGLQLVALLTDQVHGTIDIHRSDPTRFTVSFPLTLDEQRSI